MTLIATCRSDQKAIYIHDFRVTTANVQSDAIVKWLLIDERIGLLVAGLVGYWTDVKNRVEPIAGSINYDNALDIGGPLHIALVDAALNQHCSPDKRSGALGFIIDIDNGRNRQFAIEAIPGNGAIIRDLSQSDVAILGSGSSVPDIEERLRNAYIGCRTVLGEGADLYEIGGGVRSGIHAAFQQVGPTAYEQYGVSPMMGLGILDGVHFRIPGEVGTGLVVNGNRGFETGFSLIANNHGGFTVTDDIVGTSVELLLVSDAPISYSGEVIDPEHRTERR